MSTERTAGETTLHDTILRSWDLSRTLNATMLELKGALAVSMSLRDALRDFIVAPRGAIARVSQATAPAGCATSPCAASSGISIVNTPVAQCRDKARADCWGQDYGLSERRWHRGARPQNEERFRALVQEVRDYAIFTLDPDGIVTSWNAGARQIKGYEAEEVIGSHFSRFYMRDAVQRGWPEQELALARAQGRFEDEGWRVRKDGSHFWANVVITAMRNASGTVVCYSKITRDLTERHRREEALAQSEERLRKQVEALERAQQRLR